MTNPRLQKSLENEKKRLEARLQVAELRVADTKAAIGRVEEAIAALQGTNGAA